MQLLQSSLVFNAWELDHGKFSSCPWLHTTHLPGFHILSNLTIVQRSWKIIFFWPKTFTRSYVKIAYFNHGMKPHSRKGLWFFWVVFQAIHFRLFPSCHHVSWEYCRAETRCHLAWFTCRPWPLAHNQEKERIHRLIQTCKAKHIHATSATGKTCYSN